ncbi:MAG: DUF2953 domain-containing protein [Oscillospiraceae bacterium]|nr:DUF2953 domain-containing protein [Oscillospiraceae bacterium]
MIALIIIGAIILLVALILSLPLIFVVDYQKQAEIKIRLLFFDLLKEKKEKKKKSKRGDGGSPQSVQHTEKPDVAKTTKSVQKQSGEPPRAKFNQTAKTNEKIKPEKPKKAKKNIPDIDFALIKMIVNSFARQLKKLMKKIKITELYINSIVGGSDAARAALNYGLQSAAIHSALAWLKSISSVRVEQINIQPDFMREDSDFFLHFKARIKIGTVILCALAFLIKLLKHKVKEPRSIQNSSQKNSEKSAAKTVKA